MKSATIVIVIFVLASAVPAGAVPISWYYEGTVTALSGTYRTPVADGSVLGPFDIDLSVGPTFSGFISYDTADIHNAVLSTSFASGQTAMGATNLSVDNSGSMVDIVSYMWFDPIANIQLCDPVVYFNFDHLTGDGSLRFEFTDYASGMLVGQINRFSNSPLDPMPLNPVPEPATLMLVVAGCLGAFIRYRQKRLQ